MRYVGWLEWSGLELANEQRVRDYAGQGLIERAWLGTGECSVLAATSYVSPSSDPAPWYDSAIAASGEFLGLLPELITVDSVVGRAVTQRSVNDGAALGSARARHRVVAFVGILWASSDRGMAYGETWLRTILAGLPGCDVDSIRLLQSCDADGYRTLRRVGIVDGPTFEGIGSIAECKVQRTRFQLAAGIPHLLHPVEECLEETILVEGS